MASLGTTISAILKPCLLFPYWPLDFARVIPMKLDSNGTHLLQVVGPTILYQCRPTKTVLTLFCASLEKAVTPLKYGINLGINFTTFFCMRLSLLFSPAGSISCATLHGGHRLVLPSPRTSDEPTEPGAHTETICRFPHPWFGWPVVPPSLGLYVVYFTLFPSSRLNHYRRIGQHRDDRALGGRRTRSGR